MIPVAAYSVLRATVFDRTAVSFQPLTEILLRGPVSVAKYVWWTIYAPAMSMERSTELIDLTFRSWIYFAAWLTIASLAAAAIWLRSYLPLLAVGLLSTAIALMPFAQVLRLYLYRFDRNCSGDCRDSRHCCLKVTMAGMERCCRSRRLDRTVFYAVACAHTRMVVRI
jgi:hypothetical protein